MKKFFLASFFLLILACAWFFWHASTPTLSTKLSPTEKASEQVKTSLSSLPALPLKEEDKQYTIEDTTKDGVQITYANQSDSTALAATPDQEKPSLTLHFPKQYAKEPIEVQIAEGKSILIQDKTAKGNYTSQSLSFGSKASKSGIDEVRSSNNPISWLQSIFGSKAFKSDQDEKSYLSYTDPSKRITTYYAYGHDQATGEKQLKNWQVYTHPSIVKGEQVAYSFTNAKLRKNDNGTISVYYYGDQELQNDKASAEVDPSLMARAQRTLAKEMGDSIDAGTATPNFVIPKPYYINASGDTVNLDWRLSMDGKDISIDFTPDAGEYPLALDPTLSFTAPAMSNTGDVITGEAGSSFTSVMLVEDFNSDGKNDLVISASGYSSNNGRVYIFYGDGSIASQAANADTMITSPVGSYFGKAMVAGDFNSDGRMDLAVSDNNNGIYIFYNDGAYPTAPASADVTITGQGGTSGFALAAGDLNSDGRTDLIVSAPSYSTIGRAYVYYNDGSYPGGAASADIIIDGETASDSFGQAFALGDLNADGKTDLVVSANGYSSSTGRSYIFYNDGSIPTTAATADIIITGEATSDIFGEALTVGDFNADGRTDLAVGAHGYSTTGRVYIFYNDGVSFGTVVCTTGCLASNADILIAGQGGTFGAALASGDLNSDGRTDLAVSDRTISSNYGRVYIFYNDGSIPTTVATADVIINGETNLGYFGRTMTTGDFNADGKTDLIVGANGYASNAGRAYIFYNDGSIPTTAATADIIITGEATNARFGDALIAGDFNADGRVDFAIGSSRYSATGGTYIFYNDGVSFGTVVCAAGCLATNADAIITGVATNNFLGSSLSTGDFNADGKSDLVVGGYGYSTDTGRVYIFYNGSITTESASGADIIITGATTSNYFGSAITVGDLNADGKADLAISGYGCSSYRGCAYIFYNDGVSFGTVVCTTDCLAANADVIITGEGINNYFSIAITSGDFNADGRTDLVVGSNAYSSSTGRAYIFYNDGVSLGAVVCTTGCLASNADVILTGETTNNSFGRALVTGDFNSDGKTDLVVGAYAYSTSTGRVYLFTSEAKVDSAPSATAKFRGVGKLRGTAKLR